MFEQLKAFLQQVDAVVVFLFATAVVLLLTTGIFLTKFWKWAVRYRSHRRFLRRYLSATIEIWQYLPQFSAYGSSESGNAISRIPLAGVFVERTLLPATKSNSQPAEAAAFGSDILHKNHENTVILGESGAGKSTLLQNIANHAAQKILTRKWWQPVLRGRRFPILVNLSGYHNNMKSWNGQDGLANTFRTDLAMQSGHTYPDGLLEKLLAKKQCLLLLDGFDEIADPDIRNNLAENIRQFCETYPENPLLLTSRPGDVANSLPANDCWNVVSIQPLSAGQISAFISKRQDFTSGQIHQNFEQNILSGEQNWHLARNPLLLSLMHISDVQTAGSPFTHDQIFRQYLATVCQSGKPENGQANPPETEFSGGALQAILEQTGLYLHEHQLISLNRERLIRDVLPKAVQPEKRGILPPKKLDRILEALDAINPVFQCIYKENSSAEFRFAHLSIQQFLAANAMANQPKNEAQIFDQLMQRYSQNPDWWHPVAWQAISQFKSQTKYLGKLSQHAELAAQIIANAGNRFSERFRRKTIRQLAETVPGANPENCLKIAKNDPHDHLLTLFLERYRSGEPVPAIGATGECSGGDLWKSGFIQPANSDYLHSILNNKKKRHLWADVCGFLSRLSLFDDPEIQQLSAALNDEKAAVRVAAISAAAAIDSPGEWVADALAKAISDPDVTVRQTATAISGELFENTGFVKLLDVGQSIPELNERLRQEPSPQPDGQPENEADERPDVVFPKPDITISLFTAFSDVDKTTGTNAAIAFGKLAAIEKKLTRILTEALTAPQPEIRNAAALALGIRQNLPKKAIDQLIGILPETPEIPVKCTIIRALGNCGATVEHVFPLLLEYVAEPEPDIREAATAALATIATRKSRWMKQLSDVLAEYSSEKMPVFNGEPPLVEPKWVTYTLPDDQPDKFWETRKSAPDNKTTRLRHQLVIAVGKTRQTDQQTTDLLIMALSDRDYYIREAAATALGNCGGANPAVVAALLIGLQDDHFYVRQASAEALGKTGFGNDSVAPALLDLLDDPHPFVRLAAVRAIGELHIFTAESRNKLIAILRKNAPDIRIAGLSVLGKSLIPGDTGPEIPYLLCNYLSDKNAGVRQAAALALGNVRHPNPSVIDELINALNDPDIAVQLAATEVLGNFGIANDTIFAALSDVPQQIESAAAVSILKLMSGNNFSPQKVAHTHHLLTSFLPFNLPVFSKNEIFQIFESVPKERWRKIFDTPNALRMLLAEFVKTTAAENAGYVLPMVHLRAISPAVASELLQELANPATDLRNRKILFQLLMNVELQ